MEDVIRSIFREFLEVGVRFKGSCFLREMFWIVFFGVEYF